MEEGTIFFLREVTAKFTFNVLFVRSWCYTSLLMKESGNIMISLRQLYHTEQKDQKTREQQRPPWIKVQVCSSIDHRMTLKTRGMLQGLLYRWFAILLQI